MNFEKGWNSEELRRFLERNFKPDATPQTERESTDEEEELRLKRDAALRFKYKPSDIKDYLDRFVIQQDDAKKVLSTVICDHYHHVQRCHGRDSCRDYKKQNIILIGPTGVGKTYLIQNIARLIGVPFVKADATKYSETGYVGGDVEDLIRELVHQADGDIELAQCGIVYLDEIDKIAGANTVAGRDVSGHGVQRGLLKLTEETEVPLRAPTDVAGQMQAFMEFQAKGKVEKKTINTKHILFIVSGAFTGLTDIIKRRLGARQIGFMGTRSAAEEEHFLFQQTRSSDFIEYGFEAEFIGRLPVIVHTNPLSVDDLFSILKYSEGSLLKQYKDDFLAYGMDVYFTDEGMRSIAEMAAVEQTGARGLLTVSERVFRDYKYRLPDHPEVKQFVVKRDLVEDPEGHLKALLDQPDMDRDTVLNFQLDQLQTIFAERHGLQLEIGGPAGEALLAKARETGRSLGDYCDKLFDGYEHGLNLLRKSTTDQTYTLQPEDLEDPSRALERWIKQTYKAGEE